MEELGRQKQNNHNLQIIWSCIWRCKIQTGEKSSYLRVGKGFKNRTERNRKEIINTFDYTKILLKIPCHASIKDTIKSIKEDICNIYNWQKTCLDKNSCKSVRKKILMCKRLEWALHKKIYPNGQLTWKVAQPH